MITIHRTYVRRMIRMLIILRNNNSFCSQQQYWTKKFSTSLTACSGMSTACLTPVMHTRRARRVSGYICGRWAMPVQTTPFRVKPCRAVPPSHRAGPPVRTLHHCHCYILATLLQDWNCSFDFGNASVTVISYVVTSILCIICFWLW